MHFSRISSVVERHSCKMVVTGSNPVCGFTHFYAGGGKCFDSEASILFEI